MRKEFNDMFNEEVSRYKKSLTFYARSNEWDTFKKTAARLFDYLESIEMSEVKRKFFFIFKLIMAVIFCIILVMFSLKPELGPYTEKIRKGMMLAAIAGGGYEFFFFMNFRFYLGFKTASYKRRRELFVRYIEQDFRSF